ncbi:hypothetical protein BY458DRAFT_516976 [Sporodiniella umbellata]|nr:hypothetical protein BY458DRAFT_516976 [Sporodiniella umbellata]
MAWSKKKKGEVIVETPVTNERELQKILSTASISTALIKSRTKDFYIVMNSVPINKNVDVERCIINCGHSCIYPPLIQE